MKGSDVGEHDAQEGGVRGDGVVVACSVGWAAWVERRQTEYPQPLRTPRPHRVRLYVRSDVLAC